MKALQVVIIVLIVVLSMASPVWAQGPETAASTMPNIPVISGAGIGAGLGAALTIIGAGYGFGRIGSAALEGMARQPEIAGRVQVGMIVIAALLEGATFFALLICLLLVNKVTVSF